MSFNLDSKGFRAAVLFTVREVGKALPDVLNRAGKNVALRAIQLTPKADKAKIQALSDKEIAAAVAKRLRAKGKLKSTTAKQFKAFCRYEKQRRIRSRGYTAGPGWNNAARAFGGRGVRVQKGFGQSEAAKGKGKPASALKLVAELVNTAPASEKIGGPALQEAVNFVAKDMMDYGTKKLEKIFQKVKG
jgi:hypothetical protein